MKAAIITGASKGIGLAVANGLAAEGYHLALVARNRDTLELATSQLQEAYGIHVISEAIDVTDAISIQKFVHKVQKYFGQIDVLLNNAAINHRGTLDLSHSQFDEMLDINVRGAFNVLKAVVPVMKEQGSGYIFNMASVAAKTGFAGSGAYCSSKFALLGISEALFHELVPLGIKVTAICPSWVESDMSHYAPFVGKFMIRPEDISKTVGYLLTLSCCACPKEVVVECISTFKEHR